MERVYAALARVPLFENVRREAIEFERLGSLTNTSYKVITNDEAYVLRLPGKGTSDYIDRVAEEHNTRIASTAGINAEVLFFDTEDGLMLSRFVEGTTTLDVEGLKSEPGTVGRVAKVLKDVHRSGWVFESRFDVFAKIDHYLTLLHRLGAPLPEDFDEVKRGAEEVCGVLESSLIPLAPCHNDTWPKNFLDTGERIYLIDWEFSGMNDPMWDLADLSIEAGFTPEQDRTMMKAYWGGYVPPVLYARLELYKTMSDLLWALWGMIEQAHGNQNDDWGAYALERFEHCKKRMGDIAFGRNLGIVGEGHPSLIRLKNPSVGRVKA